MGLWPVLQLIENCIFYIYGRTRDFATHNLPYYYRSTCCSLINGLNISMNLIKSRLLSGRMMSTSLAAVKGEAGTQSCRVLGSGCCVTPAWVTAHLPRCHAAVKAQFLEHESWVHCHAERGLFCSWWKCLSVV